MRFIPEIFILGMRVYFESFFESWLFGWLSENDSEDTRVLFETRRVRHLLNTDDSGILLVHIALGFVLCLVCALELTIFVIQSILWVVILPIHMGFMFPCSLWLQDQTEVEA